MPGQEKFVFEYYKKIQLLLNIYKAPFMKKIINFIKSKINLIKKDLTIKEAEKMITDFNEKNKVKTSPSAKKKET